VTSLRPKSSLLTGPFVLCAVANLFQGISFNLYLHMPGFLSDLGASPVVIGWIFAVTAMVAIAVRPGIGTVMDRHGRRRLILVGNVLNVVVTALYLTVDQIGPWVYLVRMLHGIAEAILFTVLFTFAADHVPRARLTEGLALFGVSGMLPMSIGGVLGDWILAHLDYTALFQVAVGFAALALLASLPLRDAVAGGSDTDTEPPRGFIAAMRQRDLLPLWWITLIFFVALSAIFIFLKTFVMTRGVGSVGSFFTAYTGVAIALRVFFGWVPDRLGPIRVLIPSVIALAVGTFALAMAESSRAVSIAGALCGLGHGYAFPILSGLVVGRARERDRGSAVAIYTGIADVGAVIGGPLFGLVLNHSSYAVLYSLVSAILIAGLIAFLPWDARVQRSVPLASGSAPS